MMTNRTTALVRRDTAGRRDRAAAALASMAGGPAAREKTTIEAFARMWKAGLDVSSGGAARGPADEFRQSLWSYRAIYVLASCAGGVPIRLSHGPAAGTRATFGRKGVRHGPHGGRRPVLRGEKAAAKAREGDIVEGGPLFDLLARPEPGLSWSSFMTRTVALMRLRPGRVLWRLDEMTGPRPGRLQIIPGEWTTPITPSGRPEDELLGWTVRTPWGYRYSLLTEESICWACLNPLTPHLGLSPLEPARLAIASDYNASLFNAAMFGNNAEPGGVLETEAPFNPEQNDQMAEAWMQNHGGPSNARAMAILWGGLKWKSVASTMQDMQFNEGKRLARTEEVGAQGVPEVVAGFYSDANYGFAKQGREQFWQDTMMPLLDEVAEGIAIHLAPRFDARLEAWFDVEDVPIIQEMRLARIEAVTRLADRGVPMADLNDLYDLGLPDRPWYETGWIPAGMLPADLAAESERVPSVPEGQPPGADAFGRTGGAPAAAEKAPAKRPAGEGGSSRPVPNPQQVWDAWASSWNGLARVGRQVLRTHWLVQEKKVARALARALEAAGYAPRKAVSKTEYEPVLGRVLAEVFDDPKDRKAFRVRMRAYLDDGQELGLRQALSEAGLAGDALQEALRRLASNPAVLQALGSEAVVVSTLVDAGTRATLKRRLAEGLEAGETAHQLGTRVQDVMANSRAQAMTVARNTVGQTLARARHEGHRAGGMTHKKWLHSRGGGERRPAHVAAEARYADHPIGIEGRFEIGEARLLYPRDFAAGVPGETVNCQCVSIASRAGGDGNEGGEAAVAAPERFVSYADMLAARRPAQGGPER